MTENIPDTSHFVVAVGTMNAAKLQAARSVLGQAFNNLELVPVDVGSGVIAQPMDDTVSLQGATNRARAALSATPEARLGVGLEGNVANLGESMFLRGWAVILGRDGAIGRGHSAGVELPQSIADEVDAGKELGPLMQKLLFDSDNTVRHSNGTNGILTGGFYTRQQEFADAIRCALAPFMSPAWYSRQV